MRFSHLFAPMNNRENKGVSFVEMLVATIVISLLLYGVYAFLSSATTGSRQGQETSSHIRSTALLFRALQLDIQGLLPWVIKTVKGNAGFTINGSPSPAQATELLFCSFQSGRLLRIRYIFDKQHHEVRRILEDGSGKSMHTAAFGTGFIDNFTLQYDVPNVDLMTVNLTLGIAGSDGKKIKGTNFSWFFSRGVKNASEAANWVYHINP